MPSTLLLFNNRRREPNDMPYSRQFQSNQLGIELRNIYSLRVSCSILIELYKAYVIILTLKIFDIYY